MGALLKGVSSQRAPTYLSKGSHNWETTGLPVVSQTSRAVLPTESRGSVLFVGMCLVRSAQSEQSLPYILSRHPCLAGGVQWLEKATWCTEVAPWRVVWSSSTQQLRLQRGIHWLSV